METGEKTLLKQDEILGGYNQKNYFSERLYAKSRDGKKIPVSIVYIKIIRMKIPKIFTFMDMDHYGSTIDPYF